LIMTAPPTLDARLANIEDRVKRLLPRVTDDYSRRELGMILHGLSDTRLELLAPKAGDKRTTMRVPLGGVMTGRTAGGELFDCGLHDISVGGALIEVDRALDKDQVIWMTLPAVEGEIEAEVLGSVGDLVHLGFRKISPETELHLTKSIDGQFLRY
jgi:PilZ domain